MDSGLSEHVVKGDAVGVRGGDNGDQSELLQCFAERDVLAEAVSADSAVDAAAGANDADDHGVAAAAPRVGFFFDGASDFIVLVLGQRVMPVEEAKVQGLISRRDAEIFGYIGKYLRKVAAEAGA